MKNVQRATVLVMVAILVLTGCTYPGRGLPTATRPAAVQADTSVPSPVAATQTSAAATDTVEPPLQGERGPEAIMVLEPGPGSRVANPLHVRGVANPTFEQTLAARLVDSSGSVLLEEPLMIRSPLGERGKFETEIEFAFSSEVNALLQIYEVSARDGGIVHLSSVGITLTPSGSQEMVEREAYTEQVAIFEPQNGQQVSGGSVHVRGVGIASFEGTLVLELYDAEGTRLDAQPIIVDSPDMGHPGSFEGDLTYSISQPGPARVVVADPIPTANGVNHIASVEIRLQP